MEKKKDLSQIQWFHAVNSRAELQAALDQSALNKDHPTMIEADILLGSRKRIITMEMNQPTNQSDQAEELVPIMAHPPIRESDLTFQDFIAGVVEHLEQQTVKNGGTLPAVAAEGLIGIKLDFKSPQVVPACLAIIRDLYDRTEALKKLEIWLNADILSGPGGQISLFDAERFVDGCLQNIPNAKLSLGFTTGTSRPWEYTPQMVDEMLDLCQRKKLKDVTFALNATLLMTSPACKNLVVPSDPSRSFVENYTITVWGEADEEMLQWVRTCLDPARTYVDIRSPDSMLHYAKKLGLWLLGFQTWKMPNL